VGLFTGWRKKKPSSEPQHAHTLPDFVRGIQHAVNSAMMMYEQNAAAFLDRHLKDDGSPEIQVVKIPNSKHVLIVPTMAATHPPDLMLEEIEVRMSIRVDKTEMKPAHPDGTADLTRSSFQVSLCGTGNGGSGGKESNVIDLVMKFKRGHPPEGVSRIMEEFVRSIQPIPEDQAPKATPPAPPPEPPTS
jgi:hypothetical protein